MSICLKEECTCSHRQLLNCIKEGLNDEGKELAVKMENYTYAADNTGKTLLHYSVKYGNIEMTQFFIDKGCQINAKDKSGVTPLMMAVETTSETTVQTLPNLKLIEILLNNQADIFISDSNGMSALQRSFYAYFMIIKLFDAYRHVKDYPLYITLLKLLARGLAIFELRDAYRPILDLFIEIIQKKLLTSNEATIKLFFNSNPMVKFICASCCDIELLTSVILKHDSNADVAQFRDSKLGLTLLHCACILEKVENVKLLVDEYGVNVNTADETGVTPLMLAVKANNFEIVEILLANNADCFVIDCHKNSVFERTLLTKRIYDRTSIIPHKWPILEIIVDQANEDFLRHRERTIEILLNSNSFTKFFCVAFCSIEISSFVLQNTNYAINMVYKDLTALRWAMRHGKIANVKLLIDYGAEIGSSLNYYTENFQYVDKNSEVLNIFLQNSTATNLRLLLERGNKETVRTVLKSGIDLTESLSNKPLVFVLMLNTDLKPADIVELGISIDVNQLCPVTNRPLLALMFGQENYSKIEFLLDNGADVNYIFGKGFSVLAIASLTCCLTVNRLQIIELLLIHGADAQVIMYDGKNLIDRCFQHSDAEQRPIKPILAHLAMLEMVNKSALTEMTRNSISAHEMSKNYFDLCLQQLEYLKTIELFETVTLFDFLQEHKKQLVRYAHNRSVMNAFECAINSINLESYYLSRLKKRVEKAVDRAKLERTVVQMFEAAGGLFVDVEHLTVCKISDYVNSPDICNLRQM